VGERVFPIAQKYVHRVVLVGDDAIRMAQRVLWQALRIAAEPGGAAALSALLSGAYRPENGHRVGILISGGNTTAVDFHRRHWSPLGGEAEEPDIAVGPNAI